MNSSIEKETHTGTTNKETTVGKRSKYMRRLLFFFIVNFQTSVMFGVRWCAEAHKSSQLWEDPVAPVLYAQKPANFWMMMIDSDDNNQFLNNNQNYSIWIMNLLLLCPLGQCLLLLLRKFLWFRSAVWCVAVRIEHVWRDVEHCDAQHKCHKMQWLKKILLSKFNVIITHWFAVYQHHSLLRPRRCGSWFCTGYTFAVRSCLYFLSCGIRAWTSSLHSRLYDTIVLWTKCACL